MIPGKQLPPFWISGSLADFASLPTPTNDSEPVCLLSHLSSEETLFYFTQFPFETGSHYVAQDVLRDQDFSLPYLPRSWDYKYVLSYQSETLC